MRRLWLARAPRRLSDVAAESGKPASGFPDTWLRSYLESLRPNDYPAIAHVIKYLRSLVVELVRARPAAILPTQDVSALIHSPSSLDESRLSAMLAILLDLGLGAKPTAIFDYLPLDAAVSPEDAAEICFAQLRPTRLEIRMNPDYIEAINGAWLSEPTDFYERNVDESVRNDMLTLEDRMFMELGLRLPSPVLVPDRDSDQGIITVRVNDLDGLPIRGLDKDTVFVPHPPEALARVGVPGIPILDPAGTYVGTQVGREHRGILSEKTLPFIGMREFFFEALRA